MTDPDSTTFQVQGNAYGPAPSGIEKPSPPLAGPKLMADVRTIVGFARAERRNGEPLWGRVSGMPGEKAAVEWAVGRLKAAGYADARIEEYPLERPLWQPRTWEVRLIGDAAFGAGTRDLVLASAFPQTGSNSLQQPITAPVVFVGRGSPAELANVDVTGKIAVVNVVPNLSLYASRERGVARALVERGAVAVINAIESPGNFQYFDGRYACGPAPCFIVGGNDGAFLESVIGRAAAAGAGRGGPPLRATLSLQSRTQSGLTGYNGLAILPGRSPETIIVNAHADSWFDGANDNADGLAVLLGLAEHFAAQRRRPERTIVFMVSGGHHTGNGPAAFIQAHPEIIEKTVMVINLEHLAQINVSQASRLDPATGGYASGIWSASTVETPKSVGAANTTQYVFDLMARASKDFGVVTAYQPSEGVPGDLGAYSRLGLPAVQLISSEVYYHSSGDSPSTISTPGLEKAGAFFAWLIDQLSRAPRERLVRAPAPAAAPGPAQ